MSLRAFYPFTGTFTVMGLSLLTYGVSSGSLLMIAQGLYLTYMGVHITWTIWTTDRQEGLLSE